MQTSNSFYLTVSSIEIDDDLVIYFTGAAIDGDVMKIKELLQAGVPVDCVNEFDQTPLMIAADLNGTEVNRLLLQKVADVNKRDRLSETLTHYAARWNSPEAIAVLMVHGTSINIKNDRGDKPIDLARPWNSEGAGRMLEQL